MIKDYFLDLFLGGSTLNEKHIIQYCNKYGKKGNWLDLGCDDGEWTSRIISPKKVKWHGIEVVSDRARLAQRKGINISVGSLTDLLPYHSNFFDLVHSNQVIEHLFDLDVFISEIFRVLKKNGILVISTENPASWHNIFALIMGWQMFTATNISTKKRVIGNPLSIHGNKDFTFENQETNKAWEHNKLLTPRALSDLLEAHGFFIEKKIGAGYHPLPPFFGEIDVNHSHFYTIVATKK
jgi:SAM-dependent methyltransferase